MIPAKRSNPRAVDDAGSRILVRIDSAERRAPTCERSGPTLPPSAPILWQPTQPAARNRVRGSVLPPATPPPLPPPPQHPTPPQPPPAAQAPEEVQVGGDT